MVLQIKKKYHPKCRENILRLSSFFLLNKAIVSLMPRVCLRQNWVGQYSCCHPGTQSVTVAPLQQQHHSSAGEVQGDIQSITHSLLPADKWCRQSLMHSLGTESKWPLVAEATCKFSVSILILPNPASPKLQVLSEMSQAPQPYHQ